MRMNHGKDIYILDCGDKGIIIGATDLNNLAHGRFVSIEWGVTYESTHPPKLYEIYDRLKERGRDYVCKGISDQAQVYYMLKGCSHEYRTCIALDEIKEYVKIDFNITEQF